MLWVSNLLWRYAVARIPAVAIWDALSFARSLRRLTRACVPYASLAGVNAPRINSNTQIRNGTNGYKGSSIESFVTDLTARGLTARFEPLPHHLEARCGDLHTPPGSICLVHITATPPDEDAGGRPARIDWVSPPGFYGRRIRSCFGQDGVDPEILDMFLSQQEEA
jgi:hypothetical protein